MAELRACCEDLGLRDVRTFLASGNVRFDTDRAAGLKARLERGLEQTFEYPVRVVLRSAAEVEAIIASDPFGAVDPEADVARHVVLAEAPIVPVPDLTRLPPHIHVARLDDRELYLVAHRLPNGRYTEGIEVLDTLLPDGLLVTMRTWNTILRTAR